MSPERGPSDKLDEILMGDTLLPYALRSTVEELLGSVASIGNVDEALNNRVQANLIQVLREYQGDESRQFIHGIETLMDGWLTNHEESDQPAEDVQLGFLHVIDDHLKQSLGERWIPEADRPVVGVVIYKKQGEAVHGQAVFMENFYFNPPKEVFSDTDVFPPNGKIAPTHGKRARAALIGKNMSVFNPFGTKVFWGDLQYKDIRKLEGTYYVLSQRASYLSVPEYAIEAEAMGPAEDPNRPPGALVHLMPRDKPGLNPDYVKVYARGAIVAGKYIKHVHTVDI